MSRVVVSIAIDPYMRRMKKQSRYPLRLPSSIKPEPESRVLTRDDTKRAIEEAQKIVARYVPKDRDLVSELIKERREEAARE
jgi:hypothetical protein